MREIFCLFIRAYRFIGYIESDWPLNWLAALHIVQLQHLTRSITNNNNKYSFLVFFSLPHALPLSLPRDFFCHSIRHRSLVSFFLQLHFGAHGDAVRALNSRLVLCCVVFCFVVFCVVLCVPIMYLNFNSNLSKFISLLFPSFAYDAGMCSVVWCAMQCYMLRGMM